MKKSKLKLFPLFTMSVAGSITSIMTFYFQYEIKTALLILLSVLLVFYLLGLLFVRVVIRFDQKNEEEQKAREEEERLMLEGEGALEEGQEEKDEALEEKTGE